jgi:hypothetical protein
MKHENTIETKKEEPKIVVGECIQGSLSHYQSG